MKNNPFKIYISLLILILLLLMTILYLLEDKSDFNDINLETSDIFKDYNISFTGDLIANSNSNFWNKTGENIQKAIDDLGEGGGGVVFLPSGVYNLSSDNNVQGIEIKSNTQLMGCGESTVLNLVNGKGASADVIRIHGDNNVICDLNIDGNKDKLIPRYDYWHGVRIENGCSNIRVKDCHIYDTQHSCIRVSDNCTDILVEDCILERCNHSHFPSGVSIGGSSVIVKNCIIRDTYACGIVFESQSTEYPCFDCVADGNIIYGNITRGIHCEPNGYANNITVINNHIFNLTGVCYKNIRHGVYVPVDDVAVMGNRIENIKDYSVYNYGCKRSSKITNNTIKNCKVGIDQNGNNGVISDNIIFDCSDEAIVVYSFNVSISGNIITNSGGNGVFIHPKKHIGNISNIVISQNVILNTGSNGISASGDYITISDNIINEFYYRGIRLYKVRNSAISGNSISDELFGVGWSTGITVENCSDLTIYGNVFDENTTYDITCDKTSYTCVISDNVLSKEAEKSINNQGLDIVLRDNIN